MKGNTVNDKIKAFYQKHELKIIATATALSAATVIVLGIFALKANKTSLSDDLTDEEWEHLFDLARQMDEYVAERKALKSK
jgi:hypothetical protein